MVTRQVRKLQFCRGCHPSTPMVVVRRSPCTEVRSVVVYTVVFPWLYQVGFVVQFAECPGRCP